MKKQNKIYCIDKMENGNIVFLDEDDKVYNFKINDILIVPNRNYFCGDIFKSMDLKTFIFDEYLTEIKKEEISKLQDKIFNK